MGFAEKLNNLLAGKGFREDDTKKNSKRAIRREKKKKAEEEFWRGEDDMDLMTKMAMLNNDMDGDGMPDNDDPSVFDADGDGIPDEWDTKYSDDRE